MPSLEATARQAAWISIAVSGSLAVAKLVVGAVGGSNAVVADGVESVSDVLASGLLLVALWVAARPADDDHPYGHGRFELLTALALGSLLAMTGAIICYHSLQGTGERHPPPAAYTMIPVAASVLLKAGLSSYKMRAGRRTGSSALKADAWNDLVDVLSGLVAVIAVALTRFDPERFLAADHWGAFGVGAIVALLGLNVIRETALQLMDTMPAPERMAAIRAKALSVEGARDVEKCFARKTGLRYHVDLHLEVDPHLTVRASHDIATAVRICIKEQLPWVADVLVHVEPYENGRQ